MRAGAKVILHAHDEWVQDAGVNKKVSQEKGTPGPSFDGEAWDVRKEKHSWKRDALL